MRDSAHVRVGEHLRPTQRTLISVGDERIKTADDPLIFTDAIDSMML